MNFHEIKLKKKPIILAEKCKNWLDMSLNQSLGWAPFKGVQGLKLHPSIRKKLHSSILRTFLKLRTNL